MEQEIYRNDEGEMILDHPVVLSASALELNKNIGSLIEAMALYGRGTLLIAGDGSQRDALLSLAIKKLKNRLVYLGPIDQEKMGSVYEACDVLALLSINEGFGLVIIEALSHNKPVVVTADEDRAWIVGDAGWYCDPSDIGAILRGLKYLDGKDFKDIPSNQAARFSWPIVIDKYTKLIQDLTGIVGQFEIDGKEFEIRDIPE